MALTQYTANVDPDLPAWSGQFISAVPYYTPVHISCSILHPSSYQLFHTTPQFTSAVPYYTPVHISCSILHPSSHQLFHTTPQFTSAVS
ncbi:hypothetical protein DPMN_044391 [Dreissena polymorpha]|uniref:Uncharacterized protein n=1 Tax=Dreissena polymorpha TaxID=45954 RepID=A0A9D4D4J0_DREPO|nr:hypothetical protein DPMN_044391 [Dreissena polymorpha]